MKQGRVHKRVEAEVSPGSLTAQKRAESTSSDEAIHPRIGTRRMTAPTTTPATNVASARTASVRNVMNAKSPNIEIYGLLAAFKDSIFEFKSCYSIGQKQIRTLWGPILNRQRLHLGR